MKILIACEFTGQVRDAFITRGHDAISCDLEPSERPGPHYQGDVRDILKSEHFDLMVAFPECTDLTRAGAKYFAEKRANGKQQASINFFMEMINAPILRIAVENPVGIMSTVYRLPDQIIEPWMFGHGEQKATCLWLKNLPRLKATKIVEGREQRIFNMAPGPNRSKDRSRTYPGIAEAMADQWSNPGKAYHQLTLF